MTSSGGLVVLDSTVISFLMRDRGPAGYYRRAIAGLTPVLPFQAVEEAWFGGDQGQLGRPPQERTPEPHRAVRDHLAERGHGADLRPPAQ